MGAYAAGKVVAKLCGVGVEGKSIADGIRSAPLGTRHSMVAAVGQRAGSTSSPYVSPETVEMLKGFSHLLSDPSGTDVSLVFI